MALTKEERRRTAWLVVQAVEQENGNIRLYPNAAGPDRNSVESRSPTNRKLARGDFATLSLSKESAEHVRSILDKVEAAESRKKR